MQKKTILALDVSKTSTGYAIISSDQDSLISIEAKGSFPFKNSKFFSTEITDLIEDYGVDHVVYADTVVFGRGNVTMILCKIFGHVEMIACLSEVGLTTIKDSQAKSYLGLPIRPRAVSKQAAQDYAKNEWDMDTKNDDEADAIVFGVYFAKKYL